MNKSLWKLHPKIKIINSSLIDLRSPSNISLWWNFGSFLSLCLMIQILTGLFLALNMKLSFNIINHICRNVNTGWIIRTIHANGASLFFICLQSILTCLYLMYWNYNFSYYYSNSISSLCTTMKMNIILSCYCNYKSFICNFLYSKYIISMIMGSIFCK